MSDEIEWVIFLSTAKTQTIGLRQEMPYVRIVNLKLKGKNGWNLIISSNLINNRSSQSQGDEEDDLPGPITRKSLELGNGQAAVRAEMDAERG